MDLLGSILLVFIGLGGGLAVGSGFVAFLTVLDIVPRLTVFSRGRRYVRSYEWAFVAGALAATWVDLRDWSAAFSPLGTVPVGFLAGCFVGLLAAALTEVINVLPILAKRLQMQKFVLYLLMAMVFGKILGSLFQWIWFIA
ncbi:stage V sporulation protein AB [Marinithermofilum abyssi]|uniref:Stage V sporulation protein AB n=1 Tax=Marinithermofilum abyssi TaxID=1571185 RepID=A0A8J2YDI4_9BACL|nr:stage V sporulation protein AB [Marinithermofilum abyssi]GGE10868.1 stage V sporulation protein AB [Marinithermofilum abyssi]